jgi:trigger factor
MQITKTVNSPTSITFHVIADTEQLASTKQHVLKELSRGLKIQGFRPGKAPAALVEKQLDQQTLQSEFLNHLLNDLWSQLTQEEIFRSVTQPKVDVTKFVPFTAAEADYEVTVLGQVTLPDYKKFRLPKASSKVDAKRVDEVLQNLGTRAAEKKPVERAAKNGDEVTLDFKGTDAKTDEAIAGADGKDYSLVLGSNTFIPGFEPELVGLKAGDDKTFAITFPKDYGSAELQNRKVNFAVHVHTVAEVLAPKLDDTFAASVGPFKTVDELKADIRKQLQTDTEEQNRRDYESAVLEALATQTKVAIPDELIDQEVERTEADERRNLTYRGQTWQEHLAAEGVTEAEHREKQRPGAEMRIRGGIVLSEVAEREGMQVSPQEVAELMQRYREQYKDAGMQAELDKPETAREIASRVLSEKTINYLTGIAASTK